jgi:group I intron endonuclease
MKYPAHPGVYAIRHVASGCAYVGSARNIYSRWRGHKADLRLNRHHCQYLQNAWNKYGEASFVFEVLEVCLPDPIALRHREEAWFQRLEGALFNASRYAEPSFGKPLSPEQKAALSVRMRGNKNGEGKHYHGKLTEANVVEILHRYASGEATKDIAIAFGVTVTNVIRITSRKIWWRVAVPPEVEAACRSRHETRGGHLWGERSFKAKLDWAKVEEIKARREQGETWASLGSAFGVTPTAARSAAVGRTWNRKPEEPVSFSVPTPAIEAPSPLLAKRPRRRKPRRETKPRPARIPVRCETCGKELLLPPCKVRDIKDHYCSRECRLDGISRRARALMADPARRAHLAAVNRGKKASEATRAKMAAAHRPRVSRISG